MQIKKDEDAVDSDSILQNNVDVKSPYKSLKLTRMLNF